MTSNELRQKFLDYFEKKGHQIVVSSSLIPADKTVLLTSAGMQQFVSYFSGEKDILKDFGSRHLCSVQKCFRTPDIDEVGDDSHHTFFEMLGNWSIGEDSKTGYFKEGAIKMALDFFVKEIGLDKNRIWVTIFKGGNSIPRDTKSLEIWQKQGIPRKRIIEFGFKDNFWGPTAQTGPCGPCSEIHYDRGEKYGCGEPNCGPNCQKCNRFLELWNLVFMEYEKIEDGSYRKLSQRNVDTGIGLERLIAVLENKNSAYETDLFLPIIKKIEEISKKKYKENKKSFRVISDHIRSSVFLISDGVLPSNIERGYILRRILRRAIRYGRFLKMPKNFLLPLAKEVTKRYENIYPVIKSKREDILDVIRNEEEKFEKTLEKGLKKFTRLITQEELIKPAATVNLVASSAEDAKKLGKKFFYLYETYGFPLELSLEEFSKIYRESLFINSRRWTGEIPFREKIEESFKEEIKKHQKVSRVGAEKKFGGVGKDAGYEEAKLHTATHLLHAALRKILGEHIRQMGSDITPKRLRFDFFHPRKTTKEEIEKIEKLVNQKIKDDLEIKKEEMPYREAVRSGALAFFKEKYPPVVSVYSIGRFRGQSSEIFSKEICAGPHVKRTLELGKFKIIKEKSSSAGVRRIKAILE